MKAPLLILFGALLTIATASALGTLLLRALSIQLFRLEERLLSFITGAALLSGLMFLLCALHLVYTGVLLALSASAIAAAIYSGSHRARSACLPAVPRAWKWIFGVAFAAFTVLYFFNAMAPEKSPDGSSYHLPIVASYYRAHGFVRVTTNFLANLSQGLELLFLFAYGFGRYSAAVLVHFAFLVALPGMMLCYARRFGFTKAGAAAAIFVYASPVAGLDGTIAYVDVAVAAVLFALFYFIQIWAESKDNRLLAPIGMLTGFGAAIKVTAIVALPYAIGVILWTLWRARKPALRPLLIVTGLAVLFILPWWTKSWMWMGNPLTPFANRLFPNPYVHITFENELRSRLSHYTLSSYTQIPYELTIAGELLNGLFGPLFLLAPVSLLALGTRQGRHLLLATVVFAAAYYSNIGARFLIPTLPFLALAMALAFLRFPPVLGALAIAHALASWPDMVALYCSPNAWRLEETIPVKAALRMESEDAYLTRTFPGYAMNRMVEEKVPPGERIFSMSEVCEAYTTRQFLVKYLAAPNEVLSDILLAPQYPGFQPGRILTFTFPETKATGFRLVQLTETKDSIWSIAEVRVFDAGVELPRAAQWRLTAQPNPWDIPMAFDNSLVTRWRTWQAAKPGMHVDVNFGGAEKLDAVSVESAPDWTDIEMRMEVLDSAGKWRPVGGRPVESGQPDLHDLRRAATAEFKSRGIHYLLIGYDDLGSEDFKLRAAEWGIRLIGDKGYMRLYHIE